CRRQAHDAELRMQGGERIIGDLRPRGGCSGQERRLPSVGQSHQPRIGDQFQPQPDPQLLARPALGEFARGAVGRGLEVGVAESPVTPPQQRDPLPCHIQIGQHRLPVVGEHLGAERHLDHDVLRAGAGPVRAGAVAALRGAEVLRVAEVDQGVQVLRGLEDDVAALAAVAAVRSAELDELLPPERDHAIAAIPGAQIDLGLVKEFHGALPTETGASLRRPPPGLNVQVAYSAARGSGLTEIWTRPWDFVANSTLPSTSAKMVWSRPRPTLAPGYHLVPRWRTRMLPAMTLSPPNFLMPRRRPSVSRPFRDDPPAFLCAMVGYS